MEMVPATASDWNDFLGWARQEGWRVPGREVALFKGPLAQGAFALRGRTGACGFVTVVHHEQSGWIGNLLVPPGARGRGKGSRLFAAAVQILQRRGCRSLWLTASPQGRSLYEKHGFRAVDSTMRWVRDRGEGGGNGNGAAESLGPLLEGDRLVWGESRAPLLGGLALGGKIFAFGGTVALLQSGPGIQVIGPWISRDLCPRENRHLLLALLASAAKEGEVVTDVLASSPIHPLLLAAGFESRGRCDLMVLGDRGEVNLAPLVSLASLGSIG